MTFLVELGDDGEGKMGVEEIADRLSRYQAYLESIRTQLPAATYEFATMPWHYSPTDSRSLHDAWVDQVIIRTIPPLSPHAKHHTLEIWLRLLGPQHDGYVELHYTNVHDYALPGHYGEWLYDEVRLSEEGSVIHEISFGRNMRWRIECVGISYEWWPSE